MASKSSNLSEYTVEISGIPHTLRLSPEDAEKYGDKAKKATKSTGATAKTHTPQNKGA